MLDSLSGRRWLAVISLSALLAASSGSIRAQGIAPIYPTGPTYQPFRQSIRAISQASATAPSYLQENRQGGLVNNTVGSLAPSATISMVPIVPYNEFSTYGNPFYPNYYDPYGGYLRGAASVISAQGSFAINQQQAVLVREQIVAARLANKQRAFDQYLWTRDKMPTLQDDRERSQAQELRRAMTDPPPTEIWSGSSLNNLLSELQKRLAQVPSGTERAGAALDEDLMKRVNVAPSSASGNVGLIKSGGRVAWPSAFAGAEFKDERDRISTLIADIVKEAESGSRVDAGTVQQVAGDLDKIQRKLGKHVADLSTVQYIDAKRFLNNFADALKTLQRPDAENYFNRKYAARGKSVPDLVTYMKEQGLQFAPAVTGDEAAYLALYRAMTGYLARLQSQGPDQKP